MKKIWIFGMILSVIWISFISVYTLSNNENENKISEIEFNTGVALINGKPSYFDPSGLLNPDLFMSPGYRENIDEEIIKAGKLSVNPEDKLIYIFDTKRDDPYSILFETMRTIKYKVDNYTLYVSEDGNKWEKVNFKVVNNKEHIAEDDPLITVYWIIYLECSWFKGEYNIISVPNT